MEREYKKPVGAVITAAGLSSRMGRLKALLPLGDGTVLSACVDNMRAAGAEKIVVVTGFRAEEIEEYLRGSGCECVRNAAYSATQMFDSLCIGLRTLGQECGKVLITPVDVPAVKAETVAKLLGVNAELVRPVYEGRSGHPVVLDAARIPEVLSYGGEGGLRGAVEALKIETADVATDDEGVSVDADTPEDYARILEIWERR